MHHGMRDLHSCGKSVEDQPADLGLENGDEIGILTQILLCTMEGRGEMPFERTGDLQKLISV